MIGFLGEIGKLLYLFTAAFLLMGLGLLATGAASDWYILLLGALLLHSGFAIYYPTASSIFLIESKPEKSLHALSTLKSLGPLASILSTGLLIYILRPYGNGSLLVTAAGLMVVMGFFCAHTMEHSSSALQRSRTRLKQHLWPYYVLNFLNGCRSGIFKTFVLFYLINEYGINFTSTATIVLLGSMMTFIGYQAVGYLGQHIKPVLLLRTLYIIIFLNFVGFCLLKSAVLLTILFLIDSLLFCTSAITDSHLKHTSKNEDILGDISNGVSLYHLGAVIMPAIGGFIYQYAPLNVFLLGSFFAILSFMAAKFLVYAPPVATVRYH